MLRISDSTHASMIFDISWQSLEATHRERFLARKANLWRDIFPPGLRQALEGLETGRSARIEYLPGEAIADRDPSLVRTLSARDFTGMAVAGRQVHLMPGRHYPRGLFPSLPGVYPQDSRPARLLHAGDGELILDLNHPMAGRPFSIEARVTDVAPKRSDTGGRLSCWLEEILDFGPGMQARRPGGLPTAFDSPGFLSRQDESPDAIFYGEPRMTGHVDTQASELLAGIHASRLRPGEAVLDLMSSMVSHVPPDLGVTLTGLGMNAIEMAANPALAAHVVQDLNADPSLPFPGGSFDAVLISLSIEYLASPEAVVLECARVLAPGGRIMIGFSNRWFPAKATAGWLDLHEFERQGYVLDLLLRSGGFTGLWTESARNWWRPADDPHVRQTWTSDPVHVVGGEKA